MTGGRPLRFLALILGGWIAIRIAIVLPGSDPLPDLIEALIPDVAAAVFGSRQPTPPGIRLLPPDVSPPPSAVQTTATFHVPILIISHPPAAAPLELADAIDRRRPAAIPSPLAPPAPVRGANRLSGTAWLLVRGGPGGTVSGGQLGASQGGMRVTYALGSARRFAIAARLAAPLKGPGREAALGIEWQPTRWPVRLIAEQRFVLDGGRGGPTVGVIGGYGPADFAKGLRIEGYGQAGAIGRDGIEGFVDASARLTHLLGKMGSARIDIGVGAWGSAQRAAERFDIGPSIVATMPVAGKSIRLAVDWRERVVGAARPGSGPALSIGSDF